MIAQSQRLCAATISKAGFVYFRLLLLSHFTVSQIIRARGKEHILETLQSVLFRGELKNILLKTTIFFIFVQSTYTITMEKLRSLRKRRGYTQEYMSNILSTDVSNYCRKENGEVRIFDDEWEKLAKALDVPVEDIKEERTGNVVQNLTFNDSSSNTSTNSQTGNYNQYQYYNIPEYMLENHKEYIDLLKEQVEALKQELEKFKSKK